MTFLLRTFAAAALLAAVVPALGAQGRGRAAPPPTRQTEPGRLTEAQRDQLRALMTRQAEERRALEARQREARAAIAPWLGRLEDRREVRGRGPHPGFVPPGQMRRQGGAWQGPPRGPVQGRQAQPRGPRGAWQMLPPGQRGRQGPPPPPPVRRRDMDPRF